MQDSVEGGDLKLPGRAARYGGTENYQARARRSEL